MNHPTTRDLRNLFFLYNKLIDELSLNQKIHLRNKEFEDHRPLPHINWNGSYDKIMVDETHSATDIAIIQSTVIRYICSYQ